MDIAVIGCGAAGISAAITAKIRNKEVVIFGKNGLSEKITKAHIIRNYPALPEISGSELAKAFKKHLDTLNIPIKYEQVINVYAMGDYFALQTPLQMYQSKTVIIASGVVRNEPLSGENELLGKGVSYCATCDAHLYKNKTVAVIGCNDESQSEALYLSDICGKVYYFPMKNSASLDKDNITVVSGKPLAILGDKRAEILKTDKGESYPIDGIFIIKDDVSPNILMSGLQMQGSHIAVNPQMETNIDGCFACGDAVGKPYQYIKAAGEGNIAALSAVNYIQNKGV